MFGAVLAQAAGQQQQPPAWTMLVYFVPMAIIMYVVVFRPQRQREKQHAELLKTLKSGDKVVTSGGIIGTVVTVKEKSISLRSADTKLEVQKSAIAEVVEKAGAAAAAEA